MVRDEAYHLERKDQIMIENRLEKSKTAYHPAVEELKLSQWLSVELEM